METEQPELTDAEIYTQALTHFSNIVDQRFTKLEELHGVNEQQLALVVANYAELSSIVTGLIESIDKAGEFAELREQLHENIAKHQKAMMKVLEGFNGSDLESGD